MSTENFRPHEEIISHEHLCRNGFLGIYTARLAIRSQQPAPSTSTNQCLCFPGSFLMSHLTAVTCPKTLKLSSKHSTVHSLGATAPSFTPHNHSGSKLHRGSRPFSESNTVSLIHSVTCSFTCCSNHLVTCSPLAFSLSLCSISWIFVLFSPLSISQFLSFPPPPHPCFCLCLFIYMFLSLCLSKPTSKNTCPHLQVL